jgi:hypothetical protein
VPFEVALPRRTRGGDVSSTESDRPKPQIILDTVRLTRADARGKIDGRCRCRIAASLTKANPNTLEPVAQLSLGLARDRIMPVSAEPAARTSRAGESLGLAHRGQSYRAGRPRGERPTTLASQTSAGG